MMPPLRLLLAAAAAVLAVACGQKGPLYLPDRNARVVTRPPAAAPAQPPVQAAPAPQDQPPGTGSGPSTAPAPGSAIGAQEQGAPRKRKPEDGPDAAPPQP